MEKRVELLVPAGDMDSFKAALENGADAIYIGGKMFSARQNAANFSLEEIRNMACEAHIRDIKLYLTMNILISDEEMEEALLMAIKAWEAGVDAIIVQDIGFARALYNLNPEIEIHGSTQMTIYDVYGARVLKKLGFKRVILAREMALEEIQDTARYKDIEVEMFIHGALCVSYSGQCLMSSMIGGRSGNRGTCAQPCRLPYELMDENSKYFFEKDTYALSTRDICLLESLYEIIKSGVVSLKIEGRMKSPEYVAVVTKIYRKYLDRVLEDQKSVKIEEEDLRDLKAIFNRGDFSKGYLYGKTRNMMSFDNPKNKGIYIGKVSGYNNKSKMIKIVDLAEDIQLGDGVEITHGKVSTGAYISKIVKDRNKFKSVLKGNSAEIGFFDGPVRAGAEVYKTFDKKLNDQARNSFAKPFSGRRVEIKGFIKIFKDKPLMLEVEDKNLRIKIESEKKAEEAINLPLTEEKIISQLKKTGGTPFVFSDIHVDMDENVSVPMSEINDIRRKALDKLAEEKGRPQHYSKIEMQPRIKEMLELDTFENESKIASDKSIFSVDFIKQYDENDLIFKHSDRVYLPYQEALDEKFEHLVSQAKKHNCQVILKIPSITKGIPYEQIKKAVDRAYKNQIKTFLVGNLGSIEMFDKPDLALIADYTFNIYNSLSAREIYKYCSGGITLSPEMTLRHIEKFRLLSTKPEVIAYGRLVLMTSEFCPSILTCRDIERGKCGSHCQKGGLVLKDRRGYEFPVISEKVSCRSRILNSRILFVPDILEKLRSCGVMNFRFNWTNESAKEIVDVIKLYRSVLTKGYDNLDEECKNIEQRVKRRGYTRGYFTN